MSPPGLFWAQAGERVFLTQHEASVLGCDCGRDQSVYPGGSLTPNPKGRGQRSPQGPPGRQLGTSPPPPPSPGGDSGQLPLPGGSPRQAWTPQQGRRDP